MNVFVATKKKTWPTRRDLPLRGDQSGRSETQPTPSPPAQLKPMDQSHFNGSAQSRVCTDARRARLQSGVDFFLTGLTLHPERSSREQNSEGLRARKKGRYEGWSVTEDKRRKRQYETRK